MTAKLQNGFDLGEFEERLHTFIALTYPMLTLKQHEEMCEGIGAIAGDCCASHSSVQSAEQVLDQIDAIRERLYRNEPGNYVGLWKGEERELKKLRKELRQRGEREQG